MNRTIHGALRREALHDHDSEQNGSLCDYCPLHVSTFNNPLLLRDYDPLYFNMNILACGAKILYVAVHHTIYCYRLQDLFSNIHLPHMDRKPFTKLENEHEVHHIRAAKLSQADEVLIAVGENGLVKLYIPQHEADDKHRFMVLSLSTDTESTWSTCLSTQLGILVTGSNAHILTCIPLRNTHQNYFKLEGHGHNIPCVDVSSNGEFLVSGSIDTTIRLWHIPTKKCLKSWDQKWETQRERGEWIWGVRWLQSRFTKIIRDDSFQLSNNTIHNDRVIFGNRDSDHMSVDHLHDDDDNEQQEHEQERYNESDSTQEKSCDSVIAPPADELIIVASKHHLYLLDSNLKLLDSKYINPNRVIHLLPVFFRHISRLSLIEVIPELSLVLVASQSDCKVIMLRVVRNYSNTKYKFMPEKVLPEYPNVYPIAGMCSEKVFSNDCLALPQYRLYILCVDKTLHSFVISSKKAKRGELIPLDVTSVLL